MKQIILILNLLLATCFKKVGMGQQKNERMKLCSAKKKKKTPGRT